jgi:peptidyl-prolyl cis-trans isomerase C
MSTNTTAGAPPRLRPDRRPPAARAQRTPRLGDGMPQACQTGGCGGADAPPMPPPPSFGAVRIDGVEIPPEAIAEEIQHHPAPDAESAWRSAASALVIRELLLREARRRDLQPERESDEFGRAETDEEALVRTLLEEAVMPESPADDECRRLYEARRDRFRTPDLFEAAHVLIEPDGKDAADWDLAETRARAVIAEVGDNPAAFAEAARGLSACASAQQDGSLGQVSRGELLPVVQAALDAMPEGTVRPEPVRSPHGWHVIRLHRRIPGRELPYETVAPKIADTLAARSWSLAATRLVAALAAEAKVEGVSLDAGALAGAG